MDSTPSQISPPARSSGALAGLRILALNNYPLEHIREQVQTGQCPDHHLFGLGHLAEEFGATVQLLPATAFAEGGPANRWLGRLGLPLGHLGVQRAALRRLQEFDVIYSASGDEANFLALRRSLGLFPKPIVSLVHHLPNRGRMARLRAPLVRRIFRSIDAVTTLSRQVASEIERRYSPLRRPVRALPWGPDRAFAEPAHGPGEGSLAMGRTGRDFVTYGQAATRAGTPARIYTVSSAQAAEFGRFGANVKLDVVPGESLLPYSQIVGDLRSARVLAIPLKSNEENLAGLTSLLDAIALGRPVLMTRNRFIDIDIEALGFGRWLDVGDVEGWVTALRWFEDHPAEAQAMGERALAFHRSGFDSRHFSRELAAVLAGVCGRDCP